MQWMLLLLQYVSITSIRNIVDWLHHSSDLPFVDNLQVAPTPLAAALDVARPKPRLIAIDSSRCPCCAMHHRLGSLLSKASREVCMSNLPPPARAEIVYQLERALSGIVSTVP